MIALVCAVNLFASACLRAADEAAQWVDPRIGTQNGGNVIIGPSLPFGMVKPGPDTGADDQNSGYAFGEPIVGFSQIHVSGTGGGAKYGNILVQPTTGPLEISGIGSPPQDEDVKLGYYGVTLKRYGVRVELTTAARASLYRFSFPAGQEAHLLFDVGHCLVSGASFGEGQKVVTSTVQVLSPREVAGSSTLTGGWNQQTRAFTVFFYAVADNAAGSVGTWKLGKSYPNVKSQSTQPGDDAGAGAWLDWGAKHPDVIRLKIGISFVSVAQAKSHASDIRGFDFERTRAAAVAAWEEALSTVHVDGATPDQTRMFYTALYHLMLMPVDRTGENPLWTSAAPNYDDFYALWDTFRVSHPLLTLVAQPREVEIVRSLVDICEHDGFLPDARSGNCNGRTQGGSDADIVIADAYVKHLLGIDWAAAYSAAVKDAEIPPADQFKEGRGGLADWKELGYCSIEGVDRPGSKTMEYAQNDFSIAEMAAGLGRTNDAAKYFKRAGQWQNLWDKNYSEGGFTGFIRPRYRDGAWKQDFTAMQGCSWNGDSFYEANSWTYSFYVPHDVAGLIAKMGGHDVFVKRLDAFFDVPGRFDVGDEPFFLTPYLYTWAGRYDRTVERVHDILTKSFSPKPGGLPGNDDSGAMSAWYACGALGLYPNAGQAVYLLGSPIFPAATFKLANGRRFTIKAVDVSPANIYIIGAYLNGRPFNTAWIRHGDIMAGGTLLLQMGRHPSDWPEGPPPP